MFYPDNKDEVNPGSTASSELAIRTALSLSTARPDIRVDLSLQEACRSRPRVKVRIVGQHGRRRPAPAKLQHGGEMLLRPDVHLLHCNRCVVKTCWTYFSET
jgi:hypothetical protein